MPLSIGLRRFLDTKSEELLKPLPVSAGAGTIFVPSGSGDPRQRVLYLTGNTVAYLYYPDEDAFVQLASPALSNAITNPSGCWHPGGPTGTATGGGTNTINTPFTSVCSLVGFRIRITGGTGAGQERIIGQHLIGANTVFTVTQNWTTQPDATSTYQLRTGRWYVINGGAQATGTMKYYDLATNTWSAGLSIVGLAASLGTDLSLAKAYGFDDDGSPRSFASGTATAGGATTLTLGTANWTVNQFANMQIRIISGTGAGQIRTISSNTATIITVSSAWGTNPDNTSQFVIEGNEDYLYLAGNNAVTLYRYSISGNTWSTLTPGVARGGAQSSPCRLVFVDNDPNPSVTGDPNNIFNGRYFYALRGGGTATVDVYDISLNTWSTISFAPGTDTFTTGSSIAQINGRMYVFKEATGRAFTFNPGDRLFEPWTTLVYPQGAAAVGNRAFAVSLKDGATTIRWVYFALNTSTVLCRMMVF